MESFKNQLIAFLLFSLHCINGQQASTYTQPNQGKVQLEDIERDNLKAAAQQSTSSNQATQTQQYVPYTSQDQLLYTLPPQQAAPSLYTMTHQPSAAATLYPVQPQSSLYAPQAQQQQQLYIQPYYPQAQQAYSLLDFGGFSLYPNVYPYVVPQVAPQAGDYYKSAVQTTKTAQTTGSAAKSVASAQIPISNYLLSNAIPQAYYQPLAYSQSSSPYYSYNSFYQVQTPQKSVYSSGIKSTTPAAPSKGKEEQQPFVPINAGSYRYDFSNSDPNANYNKIRG